MNRSAQAPARLSGDRLSLPYREQGSRMSNPDWPAGANRDWRSLLDSRRRPFLNRKGLLGELRHHLVERALRRTQAALPDLGKRCVVEIE